MGQFFAIALELWLGALVLLILYRLVGGAIGLRGLLVTNIGDLGLIRPEFARAQQLWVTIFCLAEYVGQALLQPIHSGPHGFIMPDASPALVSVLAGSHAVYLGGKIIQKL